MRQIVIGLGFGDEGKGTAVEYLVRNSGAKTVVRFSGGGQAAHNVVLADGRHHTFSLFGSGTFAGAKTVLSKYVLVNVDQIRREARSLRGAGVTDPFGNLFVSENSLLVTDLHVFLNHRREAQRGNENRHGSTGLGIGETTLYSLRNENAPRMKDLTDRDALFSKLLELREYVGKELSEYLVDVSVIEDMVERYCEIYEFFLKDSVVTDAEISRMIREDSETVFEGSQGILLDEWVGFHPHTTWSTVTDHNAVQLLKDAGVDDEPVHRWGVTRSYFTRHGAGPFPTEFQDDRSTDFPEAHNDWGIWQGGWRVGALDLSLLRYSLSHYKADSLFLTHADRVSPVYDSTDEDFGRLLEAISEAAEDKELQGELVSHLSDRELDLVAAQPQVAELLKILESRLGVPVGVVSSGPRFEDKEALQEL